MTALAQPQVISAATTTSTSNAEYSGNAETGDVNKRVDKSPNVPTFPRDKYRVVPREKTPIKDDEIRIASDGSMPRYVTYALQLFMRQGFKGITIKATGTAITVAITLAEIIKRRILNLHQVNTIGVTTISDTYEPLEEGLDQIVRERGVAFIEILLTTDASSVDASAPGYQPPIDQSLVKTVAVEDIATTRPRYYGGGRGRGGRRGRGFRRGAGGPPPAQYGESSGMDVAAEEQQNMRSGNGFRRRGRGGYGGHGGRQYQRGRSNRNQPAAHPQRVPVQA